MSRSDRDQSGGHPRRKGRNGCSGCEYCLPVTGAQLRRTEAARRAERGLDSDPTLTDPEAWRSRLPRNRS